MRSGKKFAGSSLLTILGVVCFATILVAAAILMGSATWQNNAQNGASVSKIDIATHGGTALIASPTVNQPYEFQINVLGHVTVANCILTIEIAKLGIVEEDVVLEFWTTSFGVQTATETSGLLTYTITSDLDLTPTSDNDFDFRITYLTAGTYDVTAEVNQP